MADDAAKLRWRCRRGMRELDAVLVTFLESSYATLSSEDKGRFRELLELPDPDLHAYLLGRNAAGDPELDTLLERIRRNFHA